MTHYDPERKTPKLDKVKELVEEYNISVPLLSELSNFTRVQIRNFLSIRKTDLPDNQYDNIKSAITKIVDENLVERGLGVVIKGDEENSNRNKERLKGYLAEKGIGNSRAAKVIGCSNTYIQAMTDINHPRQLAADKCDELIAQLDGWLESGKNIQR